MQEPKQDGNAGPWGQADGSLGQLQPRGHAGHTLGGVVQGKVRVVTC